MRSLRTRIAIMTVCVLVLAVFIVTLMSVFFIQRSEQRESDQLLLLLCETGKSNLDYYFNSVQKSVENVAKFTEADLDGLDDEHFSKHIERVAEYFDIMAHKTNGVLTYYYRIDPAVSSTVKGFWYTDLDGTGFVEHEVTDITLYDTADTSRLVWFTVPKFRGEAIWLPPYITDNLNKRVISYNCPISYHSQFIGVVGIEIDYSTMAEQVDSIRLYTNGYAFLNDSEGNLFYHPRIDVSTLTDESTPATPEGVLSESTFVKYDFDGVKKTAAWLTLSNGMRINVTVPVSETLGDWQRLIFNILIVGAMVVVLSIVFVMIYTKRITRPLEALTDAADQADRGNYDFALDYNKDDEVGRLTNTFKQLAGHMKEHISDLNKRVYVDALTAVRNKGAYSAYIDELQTKLDASGGDIQFAVGVFDCDDLKLINDKYGHEKGDIYLKSASRLICKVFQHSPVFRIGGDEFSVILQNDDFKNRKALIEQFDREMAVNNSSVNVQWEQVHTALGVAVFDPVNDHSVIDVVRRADKIMYDEKRRRKAESTSTAK